MTGEEVALLIAAGLLHLVKIMSGKPMKPDQCMDEALQFLRRFNERRLHGEFKSALAVLRTPTDPPPPPAEDGGG